MAIRAKVLVICNDLEQLSKIYLALIHRNFKAEASDKWEEVPERIKRFKPAVLIIAYDLYVMVEAQLKMPAVVMTEKGSGLGSTPGSEVQYIEKPFNMDALVRLTERLVV